MHDLCYLLLPKIINIRKKGPLTYSYTLRDLPSITNVNSCFQQLSLKSRLRFLRLIYRSAHQRLHKER